MTTVFHVRLFVKFIETNSNFKGKKLDRTNQDSNFRGGSFSNGDNKEPQSNLEEKDHRILKDVSSRTHPPVITSITPQLLNWSYESS